jgi:hypothetical protein
MKRALVIAALTLGLFVACAAADENPNATCSENQNAFWQIMNTKHGIENPFDDCPMFDVERDDFFPTDDEPWQHPMDDTFVIMFMMGWYN